MLEVKLSRFSRRIPRSLAFAPVIVWITILPSSSVLVQNALAAGPKNASPSVWKLAAIKVTGSQRYQPAEIIAASGLQIGQTVAEEDFQKASQRLGEIGAFDNVSYTFEYSGDDAKLSLQVQDAGHFVPVRFENFVWFSDSDLRAKLHVQVPLFDGMLPLSGGLADQVSDALQVMLIQRKVPGHADYVRSGPDGGAVHAIVFSVTGPDIRIRSVEFTGAGPSELPILNKLTRRLLERPYSHSLVQVQAEKNFLPVYLTRGYLKAAITDAGAKVVEENDDETGVAVTLVVNPGPQYKVAGIQWSGEKVFSADQLNPLIHFRAGQPADAVQLQDDLRAVEKLYGTRGYVAASIVLVPHLDEAGATVSYKLDVDEGDVYHMGDIEMRGLDDHDARLVQAKWNLDKGAIYDSSYPSRFLDDLFKSAVLDANWAVEVHDSPDEQDKTVDVTLRFTRKSIQ